MNKSIPQVEIDSNHYKEWQSQRNFEELILPWYMPFGWAIRDYGIDGHVEITSPIRDSDNFRPDSKFFHVQLKATEEVKPAKTSISFQISVKKIVQWFSSNVPVLFVLNDLKTNTFYYLWIDTTLINSLDSKNQNWVNQKTISIKLPTNNILIKESLNSIRDYVLEWKVSSKKIIQAGVYFELKDTCNKILNDYSTITNSFGFDSINKAVSKFNHQIEQSIYRIAITGHARVGKSSLINAILKKKDISPTGFFQTTGVPIQVLPNKDECVKIYFRDGRVITEKLSPKIIKEYASQDSNEDNKKEVAIVALHLANNQLERGVSLFDIPGLNDPNESIYNYAWNTATKANAIIYVIDASSAEHGGFIFSSEYKKHILELGQSLDKIFLVFNKVNALSGNKLDLLKERVVKDLKKYDLYEKVSEKIYFISAEESLNIRLGKSKGGDTVQKLEDDIWNYLLKENKTGLSNLINITQEIYKSTEDFRGLLNTRLIDNGNRIKLQNAIKEVRDKIPDLKKIYNDRQKEIKKGLVKALINRKNSTLLNLEKYLKSLPIDKDLPDKKYIRNHLSQAAHKALENTNTEYIHQINLLKELIDHWVETNLKQVRVILKGKTEQKIVDFSDVELLEIPSIDFSSSFGAGFIAGIVGFIFNPGAAVVAAFAAFFGNLLLSAEDRRAKRISKIIEESRKRYDDLYNKIQEGYSDLLKEHSYLIGKYANEKINYFFKDIESQIAKFDTPILPNEKQKYENAFSETESIKKKIIEYSKELNNWYSSV